jgi:glycosyltransferase involved in cell wall biosynthesis
VKVPFGDHGAALDVPNAAWDPRQVLGIGPDERLVLFFGLVAPRKGLADLIRALAGTQGQIKLLVVGEPQEPMGPYRDLAEASAVDLILDERYLRYVEGGIAAACLVAADVLVLPYREGGNSGVLAVAGSYGVPTIATHAVAPPDYVNLVPPEGRVSPADPASLRHAILSALADGIDPPARFPSWNDAAVAHLDLWSAARALALKPRAQATRGHRGTRS